MEQEENVKTIAEYLEVINRRKSLLIISFLTIGFLGVVIALTLPPVYRSSATILIEDQQIPQSMVQTTITDFADKRIQLIKQRVMTRDRILSIIQKHKIYLDERNKLVPSELVTRFQEDAAIDMISANVRDPRGGGGKATIAFSISFNDRNPVLAQAVANELVSLFLNENTRVRSQRAAKTTDFLKTEADKLEAEIEVIETQIMDFKAKSGNSLPEMLQSNLSSLDRTRESLRQVDSDIRVAKDRMIYLNDTLLRAEENEPLSQAGQVLNKAAQLRMLKVHFIDLSSRYTSKHPRVLSLKRQIQTMDPSFTGEFTLLNASKELKQAENKLVLLKVEYTENHPEIAKQEQRVAKLTQELDKAKSNEDEKARQGSSIYLALTAQLRSTQNRIDYLSERKNELQKKIQELQANIDNTPLVEKEYYDLGRMRNTSLNKYAEMEAKYRAAKLAQTLEEEQKGERFTLIEPPIAPEKPEKPNRKKIAIMGFGLGLGFGFGLIILLELMNEVIRGPKSLERITGIQPIVVIPYIETPQDIILRSRRFKLILIISGLVFIAAIVIIHFFVMPLEIIWAKAMMKLGRI